MRKSLAFLVLLVVAVPAFGQWRRANLYGADVRALIVDPSSPDTLYVGTSGGEIYVSRDGAKSWAPARNGVPFPGHIVDNLAIDRNGRLWAASWGLWGGGVIAMSEDGGKTWSRRDKGLEEFSVRAIAIDPRNADFVVAGGLTGVYRSKNSGETWEKISDQINVESLAIDPRSNDRIYVGTWRQGIRTEDGGKTWALINTGMVLDTDMFDITIDPVNPDDVWVSTCGWVYNSPNRGDKWTRYRDGFNNRRIHDIEIDPCDKGTVWAGSVAGLYRTNDRGKSWYAVSDEGWVINSIALHPQRPDRVVLGVEGDGVYVSEDGAKSFKRSCDGLRNLTITSIVADPRAANHIYASVVFGGTSSGIYESSDAGESWKKISKPDMPAVLSLAVNDEADARLIAGTEKGFFFSANGTEWVQAAPVNALLRVDKVLRFNRTRFFAATSEGVFTTRDAGRSWYRLAGADNRTVDLAYGTLADKPALFALTASGLRAFDGEKWLPIEGSPERGRTLAIRRHDGTQQVFIAGSGGVKAGRIGIDRKWYESEAPDAQQASVFVVNDHVFLTARLQTSVLVAGKEAEWREYPLPTFTSDLSSIAFDPFDAKRLYAGTRGEGVFVYQGAAQPIPKKTASTATTGGF